MSALRLLLTSALLAALVAGCVGVPAGSADTGDSVMVRYTVHDLASGATLRDNRTATFTVGAGDSGLGEKFEKAVRGHMMGDSFEVTIRDDASLDYSSLVEVNKTLAPIPANQTAPRADFTQYVGEPSVGQTFQAYGIYTGFVTGITNDTVAFQVVAEEGQEDPVPSVGATLVTHVTPQQLIRELRPNVGTTFVIQPPSPFNPSTPLGLAPGAYKVMGASATKVQYSYSTSTSEDLIGKDLHVVVTLITVTSVEAPIPSTGNFGVRHSPQVNGDPTSVSPLGDGTASSEHAH